MARCITPINIKNKKTGYFIEVPCSRCWPCLQRRADSWAMRIMQEKKRSESAHFITLTYSDKHVPVNKETMQLTLNKKEIPLYMKRLRKLHEQAWRLQKIKKEKWPRLKYYAVGEYGEEFERPHYHMILFNAIAELIPLAWNKRWKYIDSVGEEKEINDLLGMIQIGDKGVTAGGARYLAQYMLTGQIDNNVGRQKPFSLMSKNLGLNYVTEQIKIWHLQKTGKPIVTPKKKIIKTRDRYYMIFEGYKVALPRYYRDKIFPKIYREIDIPVITREFADEEFKKEKKDFSGYARNIQGLRETNKSILSKKIKEKQRNKIQRELQ